MDKKISEETRLHREERKKEKKRKKIKRTVWTVIKYIMAFVLPVCTYICGFLLFQPAEINDFRKIDSTIQNLQISERKWLGRLTSWSTDVTFLTDEGECFYSYPYKTEKIMNTVEYFEELESAQRKVVLTVKEDYLFLKESGRYNGKWSIIELQDGDKTIISIDDYNESRRFTGIVLLVLASILLAPILLYISVKFPMKKDNYKNRINKKLKTKRIKKI